MMLRFSKVPKATSMKLFSIMIDVERSRIECLLQNLLLPFVKILAQLCISEEKFALGPVTANHV